MKRNGSVLPLFVLYVLRIYGNNQKSILKVTSTFTDARDFISPAEVVLD
jgi:hypothetical protein